MKIFSVLLFLSFVVSGYAFLNQHTWKWHDCSNPKTRVLFMQNFDLSPKPLKVPGNATVTMIASIAHTLANNSHYSLDVKMDKKLLGHWHPIPCKQDVGTCKYDDPCDFLQQFSHNHTCPDGFKDSGLSCTCPFNPVSLNVSQAVLDVKQIPPAWDFLGTGDFKVHVEVFSAKIMIGCFEAELSIDTPCTGFLCGGR